MNTLRHTDIAGRQKKFDNPVIHKLKLISKNKLAMLGFSIIVFFIFASLFAPLTGYSQNEGVLRDRLALPTAKHILGTDSLGRDTLAQLLYGGRVSIFIGVASSLLGGVIGIALGSLSGYLGGAFDRVMLMVSELFMTIPSMLLVMVLVVFIGQGVQNLILIFVLTGWVDSFRIIRSMYYSLREEAYVYSCLLFGISKRSVIFRHILPNALGPAIVTITVNTGYYILSEAGLSFLGMGVPSGTPTWGNMINAAKDLNTLTKYPWLWIPVGIAISLFVLSVNFIGDGLRDAFDPKQ